MNALIIYDSLFGNTWRIAETIAGVLKQQGTVEIIAASQITRINLDDVDLLVIGAPTQFHKMPLRMAELLETVSSESARDLPTAVFDTRYDMLGWLSGSAAKALGKELRAKGAQLIVPPESFFVVERQGPLAAGEMEHAVRWTRQIVAEFYKANTRQLA